MTASNKVYDGNASATIATRTLDGVLGTDDVTYVGGTATFDDRNVGTGKTVTATGLSLAGAHAGNYSVNDTTTTLADITKRGLTVTPNDLIKEGGTAALLTGTISGVAAGDDISATYASDGAAASAPVGQYSITVTGITVNGETATFSGPGTFPDALANYTVTTQAATLTVSDTLVAGNGDNTWEILGGGQVRLNGTTYTGVKNLIGGGGNDRFFFANGAATAGRIDGGGGVNTLDYSAYTTGVAVDLAAGTAAGTAGIVTGTIQNVTGGSGNDSLAGDGQNNVLTGGPGSDVLSGRAGNDTYVLGLGAADVIYDTEGVDTLDFSSAWAGIHINLGKTAGQTQSLVNDWEDDDDELHDRDEGDDRACGSTFNTLAIHGSIENLKGTAFADRVTGNGADNVIDLLGGDNFVWAGAGNDVITAGDGRNKVWTDGGGDTVLAGNGNNQIRTGGGDNIVVVGDGRNKIWGGAGKDLITAGGGANEIRSGAGDDTITAGGGDNKIWAEGGNDIVLITGGGANRIDAGDGNDIVLGGSGSDQLTGRSGDDILVGGGGDDVLVGGEGRDLLIGGFGADKLVGDSGDDILVAGYTSFDADRDSLSLIMKEWTSAHSYLDRVRNILGVAYSGGTYDQRLNADTFLRGDNTLGEQTVFSDSSIDQLTGSSGLDWFLANTSTSSTSSDPLDKVIDLSKGEQPPTDIDPELL